MSRVGSLPIPIPPGVEVQIKGNEVSARGPKGELCRCLPQRISVTLNDGTMIVARSSDDRRSRALHGLTRSLLANVVEGVSKGFEKVLEITGVGYRAQEAGGKVLLQVGYSHPVEILVPPGISVAVQGTNRIRVTGIDKEAVGELAARIRAIRPPDAYKGKGIKYADEKLHLKPGKAGKIGARK
jgi:large subunit ribosomal protein L6